MPERVARSRPWTGTDETRAPSRSVRLLAWAGLLLPAGIIQTRAPTDVVAEPFTAVTLLRGLGPGVCLLLVLVVSRPLLRPVGRQEWAACGFLVVVAASASWSLAPSATILKAGHLAVSYALLMYIARTWRSRHQAMNELAAVAYAVVVLSLVAALIVPDAAFVETSGRLRSVFPALEPVVLGFIAAVGCLMAVGGAGPAALAARPGGRATAGGLSLLALLMTASRGAVVFLAVTLLLYAALQRKRPHPVPLGLGLLVAVGAAVSPLADALRSRLDVDALSGALLTAGDRLPMWRDALTAVSDRPLLGHGYYAGHRLGPYAELFVAHLGTAQTPYIDGTWPEALLDVGLVGVGVLGIFVLVGMSSLVRSVRRGDPCAPLHLCLAFLCLLYSLQDFTLQQVGYPMVLFAGALLASRDPRAAAVPERPTASSPPTGER